MRRRLEHDELYAIARDSRITRLATTLGCEMDAWLESCTAPLPETIRLNPLRHDRGWTRDILESLGGRRMDWVGHQTEAYAMPWERGKAPEESGRFLLQSLHNTGRHTRQEAVSMLPAVVLQPKAGERVLDACAAPGSKATQLAEMIADEGVIVANEPNAGRMNKLITNRARLGLRSLVMTQHDARTYPRVPPPGFDAMITDVPCSGTGTMRKNRSLWWDWQPSVSRSLHGLQLGIALRASKLLRAGGAMVYSTCSIDPLENEAVVAQLLRSHEWLELERIDIDGLMPELVHGRGVEGWDPLGGDDDEASRRRVRESHLPPGEIPDEFAQAASEHHSREEEREEEIRAALPRCMRVQPHQNDSGGFFVALLRQTDEEGDARGLSTRPDWPTGQRVPPEGDHGAPRAIDEQTEASITEEWGGWSGMPGRFWIRGRKVIESCEDIGDWLYDSPRFDSSGRQMPGGHWHPLKVRHLGRVALGASKQHPLRPKAELLLDAGVRPELHVHRVETSLVLRLLSDVVIPIEELDGELAAERVGAILLDCDWPTGRRLMPAWLGTGLRLLLNVDEIAVLQAQAEEEA